AIGYVRARTWKVFFVSAFIANIVYGALVNRLMGDRPAPIVGLIFLFMVIAVLGVIFGFLWTLASPMLMRISRRFRDAQDDNKTI
ncbi:MAG TPA: hypothetical protein VF348_06070, partial [Usitatibacter sp.]